MACGAVLAKSTGMRVVDRMTSHTFRWRVLVSTAHMTAHATRGLMCTDEWMIGLVVIESGREPAGLAVTISAFRRKRPFVCVIAAVAIDTFRRRLATTRAGQMALLTCGALVHSDQWIFGLSMIEDGLAEPPNIGAAPLVVGMT